MKGTEAEKNVHAKTGTLNSVSSLTGYAVSRDNELLIFYISMNGSEVQPTVKDTNRISSAKSFVNFQENKKSQLKVKISKRLTLKILIQN